MTIQVNVLGEGNGLEIIQSGLVDGKDWLDAYRQTHTEEVISKLEYRLIDLRDIGESYISVEDISTLATIDREIAVVRPALVTAVIVSDPILFQLMELWIEQICDFLPSSRVFDSRMEAEAWLETRGVIRE